MSGSDKVPEICWQGRLERVGEELARIERDHKLNDVQPAFPRETIEKAVHQIYAMYECRAGTFASAYAWEGLLDILGLPRIASVEAETARLNAEIERLRKHADCMADAIDEMDRRYSPKGFKTLAVFLYRNDPDALAADTGEG